MKKRIDTFLTWVEMTPSRCIFYVTLFVATWYFVPLIIYSYWEHNQEIFSMMLVLYFATVFIVFIVCLIGDTVLKIQEWIKLSHQQ